jgi:hypothetical protein
MGRTNLAVGNRRGSVLVIFAAFLAAGPIIAVSLLEMETVIATRAEIQRTVDAGALAGASAFVDDAGLGPQPAAEARARHYVAQNPVRGRVVRDESVEVDLGTKTVAVRAEVDVPMLLVPGARVAAQAIARAVNDTVRLLR